MTRLELLNLASDVLDSVDLPVTLELSTVENLATVSFKQEGYLSYHVNSRGSWWLTGYGKFGQHSDVRVAIEIVIDRLRERNLRSVPIR